MNYTQKGTSNKKLLCISLVYAYAMQMLWPFIEIKGETAMASMRLQGRYSKPSGSEFSNCGLLVWQSLGWSLQTVFVIRLGCRP